MLALLAGARQYLLIGLGAALLLALSAVWYYRANYNTQYDLRIIAQHQVIEMEASIKDLQRTQAAVNQAYAASRAMTQSLLEAHQTARERILNAPKSDDGPVAPLLRCALDPRVC